MEFENLDLGKLGEDKAVAFLKKRNYGIVERNFRLGRVGEIDIVAYDRSECCLVFVEVKTRRTLKFGLPCESVTANKMKHLRRTAEGYMKARGVSDQKCRIDVVEVLILGDDCFVRHTKGCI